VQLTVPRNRRRQGPGRIHRRLLAPVEVSTVDVFPVTTSARTLLDIAATAPRDAVEEALDDALRRRLVTIPRMRWHLARWERSRLPGLIALRNLVGARDAATTPPQSVFETRLLRLLRRKGLPTPICQHPVRVDGRRFVLDFAYPELMLAIEADGRRWHSSRLSWERDRARLNELMLLGWRIVHVTWSDLTTGPEAVVDAVQRAVES